MFLEAPTGSRFDTALRQILVVTLGLSIEVAREALVPGLAPLIALTLIAAPGRPPGPGKMAAVFVLFSAAALGVLAVTSVSLAIPGVYQVTVAMLYLWAFYLSFDPKRAAVGRILLMMSVSVSVLVAGSGLLAAVIVWDMVTSIAIGTGLVLLAFAIAPRQVTQEDITPTEGEALSLGPAQRAILAMMIMMPLHLYLTSDGLAPIVVLLTAATMLTETSWGRFKAYGAVFAGGNLIGGLLAMVAALVTAAQSAYPVFVAVVAACASIIAYFGQRTVRLSVILIPAAAAFTLLYGMALSPLATGDDVDVVTRLLQIFAAILYVLGATSIVIGGLAYLALRRRSDETDAATSY